MIVDCPSCGKQISSKAPSCSHCGFDRVGVDEDFVREQGRRKLRDRIYHLKMTTYAVITVFVGGFGWYWFDTNGFIDPSSSGPLVIMAIGAIAYMAVRALLFVNKRRLKNLD